MEEQIEMQILEKRWCTVRTEIYEQRAMTPQGEQIIQTPVNIPVFFRNYAEIVAFLKANRELEVPQVTIYLGVRDVAEECEWFYKEGEIEPEVFKWSN